MPVSWVACGANGTSVTPLKLPYERTVYERPVYPGTLTRDGTVPTIGLVETRVASAIYVHGSRIVLIATILNVPRQRGAAESNAYDRAIQTSVASQASGERFQLVRSVVGASDFDHRLHCFGNDADTDAQATANHHCLQHDDIGDAISAR